MATDTRAPARRAAHDSAAARDTFDEAVEVQAVRWADVDAGRAILEARTDRRQSVTLVGPVAHLAPHDRAHVRGQWITDRRFGRQVQVSEALPLDPTGERGVLKLLGAVGLGPAKARALLAEHGVGVIAALDADAEAVLSTVPRLSEAAARSTAEAWWARRGTRALYLLLAEHGLLRHLPRLQARFGGEALGHLRANPWELAALPGVGLATADAVARSLGLAMTHPRRLEAALLEAIQDARGEGHSCVPVDYLLAQAAQRAGAAVSEPLQTLLERRDLVAHGNLVWARQDAADEEVVARRVAELLRSPAPSTVAMPPAPVGGLTGEQWAGVRRAFDCGVSVVCGGPGTGKTFLVRAVAAIATAARWQAALCAPTGRAARRITQSTGVAASTIHRLLDWKGGSEPGPGRGPAWPIDADLVVVDEASMLDTRLASALLGAVRTGTRVMFVGDPDQLPSVGPGRFLADLIASAVVPVTRLTVVQRQAERSQIVQAAYAINQGLVPTGAPPEAGAGEWDFFWIPEPAPESLRDTVTDLVARRLPQAYDLDPLRDILVMAPAKRGPAGVHELNAAIARRLNPDGTPLPQRGRRPAAGYQLRVGDKAMWTANDDELDLANGMMLVVEAYSPTTREIVATDEEHRTLTIPLERLGDLRPGFVVTTHKSQGGEAPVAVTALHTVGTHPRLLTREMLYTSVTRAKARSVVIGEPAAYAAAVGTVGAQRCTGLMARLRSATSGAPRQTRRPGTLVPGRAESCSP